MKRGLIILKGVRRLVLLSFLYAAIFASSLFLSYQFRFDFVVPEFYQQQLLFACLWILPLKLLCLRVFGHFEGLLSYFSTPDLSRILSAVGASSGAILFLWAAGWFAIVPPRGVILADFVLSVAGICAIRLLLRLIRERYVAPHTRGVRKARRVIIIGAGDVGAALARELIAKPWLGMQPVAFLDDFKRMGSSVHGIPLIGSPEDLLGANRTLKERLNVQEAIIAMPSARAQRIREVVKILQQAELKMQTVPSMAQLATGQVKVTALRAVEIQDLLGRASVEINSENVAHLILGGTVMVTGAGGSIGSELCRQIAAFGPEKLLLVERSEPQLFAIEQELLETGCECTVVPLVADVTDLPRMEQIFNDHFPDILFHAAAHKHVLMMERQPAEAVKNNSIATARLASLAARYRVARFVLISTDKAINPTSVMGASKRLAEMFLQTLQSAPSSTTKFMAVRFGNVLGSSGSVVPIFSRQIAMGGPVKVTHPEVTRYFMTISEATRLVLQSAAQGNGGEIFVLDMGRPVKIIDLAKQMIELSGLNPSDIEIQFTGLRPGEKLFEELSHESEYLRATDHPKIMRFVTEHLPQLSVQSAIEELVDCMQAAHPEQVKAMLKALIPEYSPFGGDQPGIYLEASDDADEKALQTRGSGKRNSLRERVRTQLKLLPRRLSHA
jgi:FlaA1/EpsC-like NDP-sugar epimerase